MRQILSALLLFWLGVTGAARAEGLAPNEAAAIKRVMQSGASAWNRGDVKGFVALSYERSPETVFLTQHGPVQGYDAIEKQYEDHYAKGPGGAGVLSFDHLIVRPLGPGYAIVYGAYRLALPRRKTPATGVFDLVLHEGAQGWRIVSDHSS